jgi:germination protein M
MKGLNKKGVMNSISLLLVFTVLSIILIGCGLTTSSTSDSSQVGSLELQSVNSTTVDEAIPDTTTSQVQGKKLTVDLYFPDKGNEAVLKETHELTVYNGAVLRAAVEGLIAGPDNVNLAGPIPENTKLLGINLKNDLAIVDFSKEFKSKNDMAEIVEKISLVDTLTGISGINKVKVLVEGYDWIAPSGLPYGEMSKISLDSKGKPIEG